jgi:hypothetical protein
MALMFVLWLLAFVGVLLQWRGTIGLALVAMAWTVVVLRLHMSSDIPLNF